MNKSLCNIGMFLLFLITFLSIVFAEEITATVTVLERHLPTGYVVLVRNISPFVIGAGVIMFILSLLFDLKLDLRKIVFSFISIAVLIVLATLLVSLL